MARATVVPIISGGMITKMPSVCTAQLSKTVCLRRRTHIRRNKRPRARATSMALLVRAMFKVVLTVPLATVSTLWSEILVPIRVDVGVAVPAGLAVAVGVPAPIREILFISKAECMYNLLLQ